MQFLEAAAGVLMDAVRSSIVTAATRRGDVVQLRTEDLVWEELDDEVVVLDLRAASYLWLNDTAATLFRELDRSGTSATLVPTMVAVYDVDPATAQRGVDAFLEDFDRRGLLVHGGDGGSGRGGGGDSQHRDGHR